MTGRAAEVHETPFGEDQDRVTIRENPLVILRLDIDPLELDISQSIPLGLILNEVITNSIKYAFPDEKNGSVAISLKNIHDLHYMLTIFDNGIGIPADFKNAGFGSLGMSLIAGLTEDLDGSFFIENNNGTTVKISFIKDPAINRNGIAGDSFVQNI